MAETDGGSPISLDSSVADLFAEAVASVERLEKRGDAHPHPPSSEGLDPDDALVVDFDAADLDGFSTSPDLEEGVPGAAAAMRRAGELLEEENASLRAELEDVKARLRRRETDIGNMLKRFEEAQKRYKLKVREAEVNAQRANELKEQSDQRGAELKRLIDRMKRMNEQVEAVRRRASREKEELERYGSDKPFRALLGVIDNFERALHHASASPDALQEGVEMILAQLLTTMAQFGVRPVNTTRGDAFDPSIHEAMVRVPTADLPAGAVYEVLQKGYIYQDRLLRASLVSVAQPDPFSQTAAPAPLGLAASDVASHLGDGPIGGAALPGGEALSLGEAGLDLEGDDLLSDDHLDAAGLGGDAQGGAAPAATPPDEGADAADGDGPEAHARRASPGGAAHAPTSGALANVDGEDLPPGEAPGEDGDGAGDDGPHQG